MNAKTTDMMVEYLVSGILALCSIIIFLCCISGEITSFLLNTKTLEIFSKNLFFAIPAFIALSYGFGIVFEAVSLFSLEWIHELTKRKYVKKIQEDILLKGNSQLEKSLKESFTNYMRYQVLKKNSVFYQEIEAQHIRMRLTRVFFIVESLILSGICIKIIKDVINSIATSSSGYFIVLHISLFLAGVFVYFLCINIWFHYFGLKEKKGIFGKFKKTTISITALLLPVLYFISIMIYLNIAFTVKTADITLVVFSLFILLSCLNFRSVIYRFERYDTIILRLYRILSDPEFTDIDTNIKEKKKKKKKRL